LELELAAMIRKLRLNRGISQAELARRIGTQQSAIARLEGGDDNITLSRLQRVAALLGAEVSIRLKPQAA
jgi:transcriptional regulator with XRE-family HTH domain